MSEAIRPAATLVLLRQGAAGPEVLMGMRGAQAVFMPSKYVFPGGGVDAADHAAGTVAALSDLCRHRLSLYLPDDSPAPDALAAAGLRELAEETGLTLTEGAAHLRFIFRAITPPGRSRRFDARFFLVDAAHVDRDDRVVVAKAEHRRTGLGQRVANGLQRRVVELLEPVVGRENSRHRNRPPGFSTLIISLI